MKIGDLVQIGLPSEENIAPEWRGIIVDINPCEYMPSFRIYRLIDQSCVWLYQINLILVNPA